MRLDFINLTNGIEAIERYGLTDYRFIRIQSTACEQKRWDDIIMSLSDDFLMSLALGHECRVYDFGANKKIPRAIWQGLEFIKFTLYRRWYGVEYLPKGRAESSRLYFTEQFNALSRRSKKKLDYYKKFLKGTLNVVAVTDATAMDGCVSYFQKVTDEAIRRTA
jgi:hypothetical protein